MSGFPAVPGKGILKTIGILLTILGGFQLMTALSAFGMAMMCAGCAASCAGHNNLQEMANFFVVVASGQFLQALFSIAAGIVIMRSAANIANAGLIRLMIIVQLLLSAVPTVLILIYEQLIFTEAPIFSLGFFIPLGITGVILSVIALVGVQMNINAGKRSPEEFAPPPAMPPPLQIAPVPPVPPMAPMPLKPKFRAPGASMLSVTGILFMVFGGMSLFLTLSLFAEDAHRLAGIQLLALMLYPAQAGFSVFVGIYAKIYANNLEKAVFIRLVLIILISLQALSMIIEFVVAVTGIAQGSPPASSGLWLLALFGLAVPIVALVGAQRNISAR